MTIGATAKEKNYKNMNFTETREFFLTRWELANVWAFSGQLQYSELFYGFYTNDTYSSYSKYIDNKSVGNKLKVSLDLVLFVLQLGLPNWEPSKIKLRETGQRVIAYHWLTWRVPLEVIVFYILQWN